MRTRVRRAFTLIEILIVVVILGILAAIVVPQFTNASQDAQISNVETQLQTIRSQIELYRVRNNGAYPASFASGTWTDLVSPDYLRSDPVNPRTNSKTIGTADGPTVGWVWDATAHEMKAAYFDETTNQWTGP
jgi:prepilin-type N-terminal cleavage/methylation domain-containing protein